MSDVVFQMSRDVSTNFVVSSKKGSKTKKRAKEEEIEKVNRFLVGGKITINRHKAVHTFLDNMFRSLSLQVQYKDTERTNFQLNFIDLGI